MAAAGFSYMTLSRPRPALPTVAGLPDLPLPSPPEKRNKGKYKGKEHSVRPAPGLPAPPPPQPPVARTRAPLPPLLVTGAPEGVSSGVEGAAAPHTLRCGERDPTPSLRPHGPLVGTHPFKCGWGVL